MKRTSKTCLNLKSIASASFSLISTWLVCCFQVKFLLIGIPKYLTESVSHSFFPFNLLFNSLCSYFFKRGNELSLILTSIKGNFISLQAIWQVFKVIIYLVVNGIPTAVKI